MTFDDGILTVYGIINTAQPGEKPVYGLEEKESYYFGYDRIGITRYYTAMQANQQIEAVVNIPGWNPVKVTDAVVIKEMGDMQYQVNMVQPELDENGLKITKLTLGRMGQHYEVPGTG